VDDFFTVRATLVLAAFRSAVPLARVVPTSSPVRWFSISAWPIKAKPGFVALAFLVTDGHPGQWSMHGIR